MTNQVRFSRRITSAFLAALLLITAILPLTVSADVEPDTATVDFSLEPTVITADDYSSCVTGFSLNVNNPDNLALNLSCAIFAVGDMTGAVVSDALATESWITVSKTESAGEDAADSRPDWVVDFHKPADVADADAAYLDVPVYLRPVTVAESTIYVLDPGFAFVFRVTGGETAADGTYPLDYTLEYRCDSSVVTYDLERPQKLIVTLDPGYINPDDDDAATAGNKNGSLSTYFYLPESIRTILSALNEDRDAFLSAASSYGNKVTDAAVYVQYDFTTLETPSSYDPTLEADGTALWYGDHLYKIEPTSSTILCAAQYPFTHESFRTSFPDNTFTLTGCEVKTVDGEPIADGAEPTVEQYYTIDTETVTLATRVRFVLELTYEDGSVRYSTSGFTDPISCGASNSLAAEPSEITAPVLSDAAFVTDENGVTTLSFHVESNDTVRETAVWLMANGRPEVGYEISIAVNGSEFEPITPEMTGDTDVLRDGDWSFDVTDEVANGYAYIRIQMRYTASLADGTTLQSASSAPLAFDIKPEETVSAPESVNTLPLYTETTGGEGELKYVCPICGICPAPYGVCLFLWIGAALLLVLLVVLIIALIPKKKECPRCKEPCRPGDKSCPVCGYRFVGSMPEIEDTTGDLNAIAQANEPSDEDFFAAMTAKEGTSSDKSSAAPVSAPAQKPQAASVSAPEQKTATATAQAHTPLTQADPAFLAELKRKMAAVKAGQPQSFTPAEIAYIKALKEKKAASQTSSAVQTAAPAQIIAPAQTDSPVRKPASAPVSDDTATREMPVQKPKAPRAETAPTASSGESREEQIARLRALRAKQLAEETAPASAAKESTAPAAPTAPVTPKRVEKPAVQKPVKQIKCPACAVPNPETNERCYICGGPLPRG